jgi:hypothetical protein
MSWTYLSYLNHSFNGTFEYGGGSKFSAYVGANAELLCVEFRNLCTILLLSNLIQLF